MRWDALIEAAQKLALADVTLKPIFGTNLRLGQGSETIVVPLM